MVAGRELDEKIAVAVMGWTHIRELGEGDELIGAPADRPGQNNWVVARYSTDIAAAWEVWEKLVADGWYPDLITTYGLGEKNPVYRCELHRGGEGDHDHRVIYADTAAHAISLAALAAVGATDGGET